MTPPYVRLQPLSNSSELLAISCSGNKFDDDISNGSRQTHTHRRTLVITYHLAIRYAAGGIDDYIVRDCRL